MSYYEQLTFVDNTIETLQEESMHISFVEYMEELESYKNLVSWNESALIAILDKKDNLSRAEVSAVGRIAVNLGLPPVLSPNKGDINSFDDAKKAVVAWGRQQGFVSSDD